MKKIMSFLIILSIHFLALAEQFNGTLTTVNQVQVLKVSNTQKKLSLQFINSDIENQFAKLKSNDFVSVEGLLNQQNQSLLVQYINYVGLQDLLGKWNGNDEFCYSFESISLLKIYKTAVNRKCQFKKNQFIRNLSYSISPALNNWSIFVSDDSETYLIDLILNSDFHARLSLYDSSSGSIIKEIQLKR